MEESDDRRETPKTNRLRRRGVWRRSPRTRVGRGLPRSGTSCLGNLGDLHHFLCGFMAKDMVGPRSRHRRGMGNDLLLADDMEPAIRPLVHTASRIQCLPVVPLSGALDIWRMYLSLDMPILSDNRRRGPILGWGKREARERRWIDALPKHHQELRKHLVLRM